MKRLFNILGKPLWAEGIELELGSWLEYYWRFPYAAVPHAGRVPIRLFPQGRPEFSGEPQTLEAFGYKLERHPHPSGVLLTHGEAVLLVTLNAKEAGLAFAGGGPELMPLLYVGLSETLTWSGFAPLHAAVVEKDGKATAFLGPSGSGKTTTLLRALEAGWNLVAEDFVWIEPATFTLYGWDKALRMLPDTFMRFKTFLGVERAPLIQGKYTVSYEHLPWFERKPARLARMVWLSRAEEVSLDRPALVRRLWEACGVPLSDRARTNLSKTIAALVSSVKHERLLLESLPWALEAE